MTLQGLSDKEKAIYQDAKDALENGVTTQEFSRKFFSNEGALQQLWSNQQEKEQLIQSELYKWLQQQLAELRRQEVELFEKEVEQVSGRLTVVVPKSLHAALKREANREGVSLSELIRLKLGYPYQLLTSLLSERQNQLPTTRP